MIAGIEIGAGYVQLCVQTDNMKEPESISLVAGREEYLIPTDLGENDQEEAEKIIRKCLKLMKPYGTAADLRSLVFCIEENKPAVRRMLLRLAEIYNISPEKIRFIDKKESFCVYLFHQPAELLVHNALLIESRGLQKKLYLLHKITGTVPAAARVLDVSEEMPEDVLAAHSISSVFLVGDFEQEWLDRYLKLLKGGRRVFAGKNLYVKGAAYRAAELLQNEKNRYFCLGEETLCWNIGLKADDKAEEILVLAEAGKNWYESDVETEVLLLSGRELEFVFIPIRKQERKTEEVFLKDLPQRPPKTTRLGITLNFINTKQAKLTVRDLGFGELFPRSDMVYEGELQWEQ